ncbi:MAG: phosphoribosylaminoimidazole carboxylase ade2 [Thelocarpon impressellum]|nr:MAG: phosphoribosylaminoimidazole carboxylase ade2 [Thelocarpon impressellum]
MDERIVGTLGGGQLGRMLVEAAHRLNIRVVVLDTDDAPAKQINSLGSQISGSFAKPDDVRRLARECDLLTVEIEHVDTQVLEEIAESGIEITTDGRPSRRRVEVQPSWRTLRVIQDKYLQKEHLRRQGIPTADGTPLESNDPEVLAGVVQAVGLPCMLKSRTQAYDGRGNHPIRLGGDIPSALLALGTRPLYVESWANFTSELAVMVVKVDDEQSDGDPEMWRRTTLAYPVVETVHEDSICKLVYAPARDVRPEIAKRAQVLARRAAASFWGRGIFGVEMFLLEDDSILVNEIAPRPHNSGHYTIEACAVSQYDAHLRAILGLPFPLGSGGIEGGASLSPGTQLITPDTHAIMLNLLGGVQPGSHIDISHIALETPGARLHLYGKGEARRGRKMGHVTVVAGSMATAEDYLSPLLTAVDLAKAEKVETMTSKSGSSRRTFSRKAAEPGPVVAVTMGSDSDLPVLKPGLALLSELGISYEVTITSAHRTPGRMFTFARAASSRGIKVIIAAAGGAAHLPGMIASSTPLPVIGVPVKGSTLDGMDSLLSIVQMPRGVPVATVSINNSINAALLAARILGTADAQLRRRLERYADDMEQSVVDKVHRLDSSGWRVYGEGN